MHHFLLRLLLKMRMMKAEVAKGKPLGDVNALDVGSKQEKVAPDKSPTRLLSAPSKTRI